MFGKFTFSLLLNHHTWNGLNTRLHMVGKLWELSSIQKCPNPTKKENQKTIKHANLQKKTQHLFATHRMKDKEEIV